MRKTDLSAGLSINLNISSRGIRALEQVGFVRSRGFPALRVYKRMRR